MLELSKDYVEVGLSSGFGNPYKINRRRGRITNKLFKSWAKKRATATTNIIAIFATPAKLAYTVKHVLHYHKVKNHIKNFTMIQIDSYF